MNNIPRDTTQIRLMNHLLAPRTRRSEPTAAHPPPDVQCGAIITHSRLDDELSVATVDFSHTPFWLQDLADDPCGFPKTTPLGTLWTWVDRHAVDSAGRTAFSRAVDSEDLLFAEMLAEFADTDVNVRDSEGMTALHRACAAQRVMMVQLCLSVPDCDTGVHDQHGKTAFDRATEHGSEVVPDMFYRSIIEMEDHDPQGALLRVLTITSQPDENAPRFPGIAMFDPVDGSNEALVAALIGRGIDLTARNEDGDTALHVAAAKAGNVAIVTRLVDAGSDVDAKGNGGSTPLHHAVMAGDTQIVRVILANGGDIGIEDDDGMSALQLAQQNRQVGIAQILGDHRGVVDSKHEDGRTASHLPEANERSESRMFGEGEGETVEGKAVGGEPEIEGQQDEVNKSELSNQMKADQALKDMLQAAVNGDGDGDGVQALLDLGASIKQKGGHPWKALQVAVECGSIPMCRMLISAGANVNAPDDHQQTALHIAAKTGQTAIAELLLAAGANISAITRHKRTALHLAADARQMSIVELLLHAGANFNARDTLKNTALHNAAENGQTAMVELLLAAGANINALDISHRTALCSAAKYGRPAVVELLLANGMNIHATDKYGMTTLHLAVDSSWRRHVAGDSVYNAMAQALRTVTVLLAAGADINTSCSDGRTALHEATRCNAVEMVKLLVDEGALITADSNGMTALHEASSDGRADIVTELLTGGAPIEERISSGSPRLYNLSSLNFRRRVREAVDTSQKLTALHLAVKRRQVEVVRILVAHGAEFDSSSEDGTPLEIARREGNAEIIEMLEAAKLRHG